MPRIQNEHTATFHFRPGGFFLSGSLMMFGWKMGSWDAEFSPPLQVDDGEFHVSDAKTPPKKSNIDTLWQTNIAHENPHLSW